MSTQPALNLPLDTWQALARLIEKNPALRHALGSAQSPRDFASTLGKAAQENGLEVDHEALLEDVARHHQKAQVDQELADEQLEAVSGGHSFAQFMPPISVTMTSEGAHII